jgi:hypothetical protein
VKLAAREIVLGEAIGVHGTSLWVMQFGSGEVWISHDAGASFTAGRFPCVRGLTDSIDPVSDSVLWVFCVTGTEGGPVVSTDGGHTWGSVQSGCLCSNGAVVAGTSAATAFVSDASGALRVTRDGGATYSTILNWQAPGGWVGFTDASVGYAIVPGQAGPGMQLSRTSDGGANWNQVQFGT